MKENVKELVVARVKGRLDFLLNMVLKPRSTEQVFTISMLRLHVHLQLLQFME